MKRVTTMLFVGALAMSFLVRGGAWAETGLPAEVTGEHRCSVCGMFVAKYPEWVSQILLADGRVMMFDGPKDMLAFFFAPEEYGEGEVKITALTVKDYYSQQWLDGRTALYVTGSDVRGPMGEEFVPVSSREAAATFMQDHHGTAILSFEEITPDLVQSMREGHKMKGHMQQ